jgi:phage-related protein
MSAVSAPSGAGTGIGVAAAGLVLPLDLAVGSLGGTVGGMRAAATAAGLVRTAAGQAVSVLKQLKTTVDTAARSLTKTGQGATAAAGGLKSLGATAGRLKGTLGALNSSVGGLLGLIGGIMLASPPIARMMDLLGKAMTVAQAVMTAINLLSRTTPIGAITGLIVPLASYLIDLAVNSQTGQRIIEQVLAQAQQVFMQILPYIGPALKVIATVVATYFTAYMAVVVGVLTAVSALLTKGFPAVEKAVVTAAKPLHGIVSGAWNGLKNAVKPVLDFLTKDLPRAFEHVRDAVSHTLHGIGGFVSTAVQAVVSVMKAPLDGITGFANWVIDGLDSLGFSLLGKHFGVHLPKIPMLAEGGIVLPATARTADRVLPLADLERRRPRPATGRSTTGGGPHRLPDFHEAPGAGARGIAEDLLFLAAAHR